MEDHDFGNVEIGSSAVKTYEIINNGWMHKSFVEKYCKFSKGLTNLGYGLEDKFKFKPSKNIGYNSSKENDANFDY